MLSASTKRDIFARKLWWERSQTVSSRAEIEPKPLSRPILAPISR